MIIAVALKCTDGTIWSLAKPNRHGDIVNAVIHAGFRAVLKDGVFGFLDHESKFLTRLEAWYEAHKCNQILPPYNPVNPAERAGVPSSTPHELFSEDIW